MTRDTLTDKQWMGVKPTLPPQKPARGRLAIDHRLILNAILWVLRAKRGGKPVALLLTAGQRHEQAVLTELMARGAVKRAGRGRPRVRPDWVAGAKGYSSPTVRRYLRRRGIGAVIPTRRDQRRAPRFDRAAYRERATVERLINRLKQFRRVATRDEKRAENDLAMVTIAAILLWL